MFDFGETTVQTPQCLLLQCKLARGTERRFTGHPSVLLGGTVRRVSMLQACAVTRQLSATVAVGVWNGQRD